MKPEFLLSFALAHDLNSLTKERIWIDNTIRKRGGGVHRYDGDLTVSDLETVFEAGARNLVVFHYSGHAGEKGLYSKDATGREYVVITYAELSEKMAAFANLKMVFINGCNSQAAADWFFNQSTIDALICTQKPVKDQIAMDFSVSFYPKFLSNNDLRTAFDGAKKLKLRLDDSGGIARGTDRGETETDDSAPEFLIRFRDNNEELGKTTFKQWEELVGNAATGLTQPKEIATTVKPLGVDPNAYLLCNRRSHLRTLTRRFNQKVENDQADPLFVFIYDDEAHCPTDFYERLSAFSFDSMFKNKDFNQKKTPLSIELPFDALEDGNLGKAQIKLFEDICRLTNAGKQDANGQWQLSPLTPDTDFWVIHHDLAGANWFEEWGDFWNYYVQNLSKQLAQQFSKRLLIVTTCVVRTRNKGFSTFFDQLAAQAAHVVNLKQFEKIIYDDISEWQMAVFKETKFRSDSLIPKDDTEGVFFLDIKDKLIEKLKN